MKKYEYKPYSFNSPNLYKIERDRLAQLLSGRYQIEHIGSTAIPGLGGKGIIDIMIAAPKEHMESVSQQAQKARYIFRPLASTETRLFLRTEYPKEFLTESVYHLHITFPESNDWKEAIAFRNYLRNHPEDLNKYAEIKKKAAQEANENIEKYKSMKESVLKTIIAKALAV